MEIKEWHEIKRYLSYKTVNNKFHLNKDVKSAKVDIEVCILMKSKIVGKATSVDGIPAKGMLISLEYFSNGLKRECQTVTNAEGVYNFLILEYVPNNFKINVYKNNIFS